MDQYGSLNVYRVMDYTHPFDSYKGEDVVLFDEFRGHFKIHDMLNYLDGYQLEFPCRYANKQACYTKVFVISNIRFEQQYPIIKLEQPETWLALKSRIHKFQLFGQQEAKEILEVLTKVTLDDLLRIKVNRDDVS
ncbi:MULTISPECIES: hypothetical protein [Paenibacillus]|uniref:Uncharacterized protein n=1 Tax=Paenibacillus pabuli TaxID=1472 RepID=A0A855Y151_9BACL|nr:MULTISPECIES: hypothetical protein [Paenibacillus]PWW33725.1 hypothetical protein DET56_11774 [Paenibacillus pabuli]PXV99995.1 hypothetical protein DEU73_11673 [Paenibacillus taichungensis]